MNFVEIVEKFGITTGIIIGCAFLIYMLINMIKGIYDKDKDQSYEREKALIKINSEISDSLTQVANTIHETNELNKELSEKNKQLVNMLDDKLIKIENNIEVIKNSIENKQ